MKKEEIARFFWEILPRRIKDLLKFLWNLFPLEIERLDDFIVKVKESQQPVVVEKIEEPAISTEGVYMGKWFYVMVFSFAKNGKKIAHRAFFEYLPANIYGQVDERRNTELMQKIAHVKQMMLQYLTIKKIPISLN